jgi:hypothetical protein
VEGREARCRPRHCPFRCPFSRTTISQERLSAPPSSFSMSSPSSSSQASPLPPLPEYTTGHCACKRSRYRVQLTNLQDDLRLSAYCHCTSCQRLNGAPFVWTTHWAEEAVKWSSDVLDGVEEKGTQGSSPSPSSSGEPSSRRTRGGARLIPAVSSSHSPSQSSNAGLIMPEATFAPTMAVYETLPGRKWKQRCDYCGTPLGSWNQAKRQ